MFAVCHTPPYYCWIILSYSYNKILKILKISSLIVGFTANILNVVLDFASYKIPSATILYCYKVIFIINSFYLLY